MAFYSLHRTVVLMLASVIAVMSAIPTFQAGERIKGGELKSKYRFSIGDFNGDGKKDIIMMSAGGDRAWVHYNEGADAAPVFGFAERLVVNLSETEPAYLSYTHSFQAMDWDGDGDLDWLTCDPGIGPMLVTNTGSASAYTLAQGDYIGAGVAKTAFAADWDKDGKNDLLVYSGSGLKWLKNTNPNTQLPAFGAARALHVTGNAVVNEAHPFVADWNNDGHPDILACAADAPDYIAHPYMAGVPTVRLYLGTANPDSVVGPAVVPNVFGGSSLAVTDWNNDGKKDILVMDSVLAVLRLYLNTGTDASPLFSARADTVSATDFSEIDEQMQVQWLDWNKDGKPDLIFSGRFNAHCSAMLPLVKVYLNISQGNEPSFRFGALLKSGNEVIGWTGLGRSNVVVCDINHDGFQDMYYSNWKYASGFPLELDFFQGNASTNSTMNFAAKTLCGFNDTTQKYFLNPAAGDLNGDGLEDLVFAQSDSYPYPAHIDFYRNAGTSATPLFSSANSATLLAMNYNNDGEGASPYLYDLDNDGLQDLLLGVAGAYAYSYPNYPDAGVRFYRNAGSATAPAFTYGSDAFCALKTGGPVTLPPTAYGHAAPNTGRQQEGMAPVAADYDNDGRPDLMVAFAVNHGGFNVHSSELWLFRNGGGSAKQETLAKTAIPELNAYPNPFTSRTSISFKGGLRGKTQVTIHDLSGRKIMEWDVAGIQSRGKGLVWDASSLPTGVYVIRLKSAKECFTRKVTLIR